MKIGILTFHFSLNYGAQLQCYALKQYLRSLGHDVYVVNCNFKTVSPYLALGWKRGVGSALKRLKTRLLHYQALKRSIEQFQQERLHLTAPCSLKTVGEEVASFDALFFGSDQVWGASFHASKLYFGVWSPPFMGKKISYSPCCAVNRVSSSDAPHLREALLQFSALSVRNSETQDMVESLIGVRPRITIDPTLLYEFEEFKQPYSGEPYILTYILGDEIAGGHEQIIAEIRKQVGNLPVYSILLSTQDVKLYRWMDKKIWDATPEEWFRAIQNCAYFYTDSFHGLIFGLKLNVPVLAYYTEQLRASRFIDFSARFHTHQLVVSSVDDAIERGCIVAGTPDYAAIKERIDDCVAESVDFITEALEA